MGKVLLVCRLTVKDIRHRPVQALLLLLAIATAATTLTLGLALCGTTDNPYEDPGSGERAGRRRDGLPGRLEWPWAGNIGPPGRLERPEWPRVGRRGRAGAPRAHLGRGRAQRAVPRDVGAPPDGAHDGGAEVEGRSTAPS